MRILTGFYVYGAICYLLIGAASITWNDRLSFAWILASSAFTAISYLAQEPPFKGVVSQGITAFMVFSGWVLPVACAAHLVFWR